jgi:hypothetical protein
LSGRKGEEKGNLGEKMNEEEVENMLKEFKLSANKLEAANADLIKALKGAKEALENLYGTHSPSVILEKEIDRFHREACQKSLINQNK